MEPRAAAAQWDGDRLTVWTGTQRPSGVRDELAEAFSIPQERVRVIVPDTGGGFGGKHTGDAAVEAARLAKGAGKPVAVHWTREEEFTWAYFRPAALLELAAAFDGDGRVTAWDFANHNSGTAGIDCPYAFASKRIRFIPCESPLRTGSYRALAATANNFAREAFLDRLAAARKQDPLAFRLEYLGEGRLRDVLNAAAAAFGWTDTTARPAGVKGAGIACGTEKGSFVATCVEVAMEEGAKRPSIRRVTVAFDCGPVHHPKNLRAQIEGAIVMGLGAVLREAMVFADGKIENYNFKKYRVPRFRDVPPIEVIIVDRPDVESAGAGETPIIALAPAVANAMFHATGAAPAALPIADFARAT
jgi:isoquinoline 1-oxidoreductase